MSTEASTKIADRQESIAQDNTINLTPYVNKKSVSKDAAFAVQMCRNFFKVLGIWSYIDPGVFSWRTVFGNVAVLVCCYSIVIGSVPVTAYMIIDEKPIKTLILIVRCVFIAMGELKYFFLRFHRKTIDSDMKQKEFDWLNLEGAANRDTMMENVRSGHLVTRLCATFTYSGATFQALLPIVVSNLLADNTHSINATATSSVRRFAVPSHFHLSVFRTKPIYEFIYSSQEIATVLLHSIAIACYSLAVVLVIHVCEQLEILIGKLRELVDGDGKMTTHDSVDGRMTDILRHHELLGTCISSLLTISAGLSLRQKKFCSEYGSSNLVGAPTGFAVWGILIGGQTPLYAYSSMRTFVFNIFCSIYYMKVGETVYMIGWHRLPRKRSLNLGLMITMTRNPVISTAGGGFRMSFRCFARVIETSMYLNVLRTVMV